MRLFTLITLCLLVTTPVAISKQSRLFIGGFSNSSLEGWKEKEFSGSTHYEPGIIDDQTALQAISKDAASGLFKEQKINIKDYPYMHWRWRIENRLPASDEKSKHGDDYSARLYVVIDGGLFIWRTRAINYVWSRTSEKGNTWDNAYAGESAKMVAVRSGNDDTKTWYTEKRNVYQDFKDLFGQEVTEIDVIAIMTDSDNSHAETVAWYGDIYFTAE